MIDNREEYPDEPREADVWIVRLDETSHYVEEGDLRKYCDKIWGVYLINRELHVHICSFDPSYEALFLHSYYELKDGANYEDDELIGRLDEQLQECDIFYTERWQYFNVRGFPESAWYEHYKTFTHESLEEYNDEIKDLEDGYRGNPIG